MIEISNNFISIVVIGAFNPSILTKSFIENDCGFKLPQNVSESNSPILSKIENNDINIIIELDRFQVLLKNHQTSDIETHFDFIKKYLEVLAYTPLRAIGFNLNYNISNLDLLKFNKSLKSDLYNYFEDGINELDLFMHTNLSIDKVEAIKNFRLSRNIQPELLLRFELKVLNDLMVANFNYEIPNLNTDRNRINLINKFIPLFISNKDGIYDEFIQKYKK